MKLQLVENGMCITIWNNSWDMVAGIVDLLPKHLLLNNRFLCQRAQSQAFILSAINIEVKEFKLVE